ncbi:MAG: DUF4760 domain-containing protein [Bryobacteraceae bacterium]
MTEKPASHDDANLILRLYELRREERLRKARDWFVSSFKDVNTADQFMQLCPPGSPENAYFRMVVSYWDMAASFVTAGVLNPALFFRNSGEMMYVWERLADVAPALRAQRENPAMWSDLEQATKQMIEWSKGRAPEAYGAFKRMVRGA